MTPTYRFTLTAPTCQNIAAGEACDMSYGLRVAYNRAYTVINLIKKGTKKPAFGHLNSISFTLTGEHKPVESVELIILVNEYVSQFVPIDACRQIHQKSSIYFRGKVMGDTPLTAVLYLDEKDRPILSLTDTETGNSYQTLFQKSCIKPDKQNFSSLPSGKEVPKNSGYTLSLFEHLYEEKASAMSKEEHEQFILAMRDQWVSFNSFMRSVGIRIMDNGVFKSLTLIERDTYSPADGTTKESCRLTYTGTSSPISIIPIQLCESHTLGELLPLDECDLIYEEEPLILGDAVPGDHEVEVEIFGDRFGCPQFTITLTDLTAKKTYQMYPKRIQVIDELIDIESLTLL